MHSGRANCNWIYNRVGFRTEGFISEVSLYSRHSLFLLNERRTYKMYFQFSFILSVSVHKLLKTCQTVEISNPEFCKRNRMNKKKKKKLLTLFWSGAPGSRRTCSKSSPEK